MCAAAGSRSRSSRSPLLAETCAKPASVPTSGTEPVGTAPTVAELTCEADGTTSLANPEVLVRPDGVHIEVQNRLDEPASLNGLGMDVDPGHSEWTLSIPPGEHDIACWPFSDHGSGVEPTTTTLRVLDPGGLYVSPEFDCPEGEWSLIIDFAAPSETDVADPDEAILDPIQAARHLVTKAEPGDELVPAGYPEQDRSGTILVLRDGAPIVAVSVSRADDAGWYATGADGCQGYDVL